MFGPKVIGEKAFAEQQQRQKGGSAFGPRVRDDLPGKKVESAAQKPGAQSVHGERVETGETGLSVEQFKSVLDSNAAFLETLYVQELERPEGPRRECLLHARAVAISLNNRADVVAEIDEVLADIDEKAASLAATPPSPVSSPSAASEDRAKRIAEVEALDNFAALVEIAEELGLPKPKSKAAAKEAIIAKLSE